MKKNKQGLDNLFFLIFKVPKSKNKENIDFNNLEKWDSLNHVKLILSIESKFKIKIDPEKSMQLMSYKKILNFLNKKR